MYRILKKVTEDGKNSAYAFVTQVEKTNVVYMELETRQEVDMYIEEQLNAGVPKTSLEVVEYIPYKVNADLLENDLYVPLPLKFIAKPMTITQGMPFIFTIDADPAKFLQIYLNGVLIPDSAYTVTRGSTIITFKAEFSELLNAGENEFKFEFENGVAEVTVTVENPKQDEPTEEPGVNPPIETDPSIPETGTEDTETEGSNDASGKDIETEETAPTE